jgi:colicin import membrane protein
MTPQPNSAPTAPPPTASEKLDGRGLARAKRAALRRRTGRIRRTIAGLTAALFVAAFLGIYVQLASGHDPALVASERRTAAKGLHASVSTTGSTAASKAAAIKQAAEKRAAEKRAAEKREAEQAAAAKSSSASESSAGESSAAPSESSGESSSSPSESSSSSPSSVTTKTS